MRHISKTGQWSVPDQQGGIDSINYSIDGVEDGPGSVITWDERTWDATAYRIDGDGEEHEEEITLADAEALGFDLAGVEVDWND